MSVICILSAFNAASLEGPHGCVACVLFQSGTLEMIVAANDLTRGRRHARAALSRTLSLDHARR